MNTQTKLSNEQIKAFCIRNQIKKMALFGSVLRDDFGEHRDLILDLNTEAAERMNQMKPLRWFDIKVRIFHWAGPIVVNVGGWF